MTRRKIVERRESLTNATICHHKCLARLAPLIFHGCTQNHFSLMKLFSNLLVSASNPSCLAGFYYDSLSPGCKSTPILKQREPCRLYPKFETTSWFSKISLFLASFKLQTAKISCKWRAIWDAETFLLVPRIEIFSFVKIVWCQPKWQHENVLLQIKTSWIIILQYNDNVAFYAALLRKILHLLMAGVCCP